MAYVTIPPSWITVGEAIKKRLLTRVKDDLDDHETRINALEGGNTKIDIFNFGVSGYFTHYSTAELKGIGFYQAPSSVIITQAKITLISHSLSPAVSSSAGILEIDLERSVDGGLTWASILSVRPSIGAGVSADGSSSSLVSFITGGETLAAGDRLRVNVTSLKTTQGSFSVSVYGDIS